MMEKEKWKTKLIPYLEGALVGEEKEQLEAVLTTSQELNEELHALRTLFEAIDDAEEVPSPPGLDRKFYELLEKEKSQLLRSKNERGSINFRLIAASISLLLLVSIAFLWQFNRQIMQLQKEVDQTQKMLILSMLQHSSASDRIQAVNVSLRQIKMDDQIIHALDQTLNYDDNVNVRLKAVEALSLYLEEKQVIDILLKSLIHQTYPQVQIALIEALTQARKKEAMEVFKQLIEQEELMDIVRDKAAEGIGVLY